MDKVEILEAMEGSIFKLSVAFIKKLPPTSHLDIDDLQQECRIAIISSVEDYDPSSGAKAITFFTLVAKRHLCNLLKAEYKRKRYCIRSDESNMDTYCVGNNTERMLMVAEFLESLRNLSEDFLEMIIVGVPDELRLEEKRCRRIRIKGRKKYNTCALDSKAKYSVELIENFFGISIRKIQEKFNNYCER